MAFDQPRQYFVRGKMCVDAHLEAHLRPQADHVLAQIGQHDVTLVTQRFRFLREDHGPRQHRELAVCLRHNRDRVPAHAHGKAQGWLLRQLSTLLKCRTRINIYPDLSIPLYQGKFATNFGFPDCLFCGPLLSCYSKGHS